MARTLTDSLRDLWITAGIFSSHYLLERLPQAGSKIWPSDEEALSVYRKIQGLYTKVNRQKWNEADTERRLIDKVFTEIGFGYLNQNKIPEIEHRLVPDYFLYSSPEEADKAFELSSHKKYSLALSIAESKRWDHNLDQPSSGKGKAPKGRYPHQQIRDYLNESEHIKWGILTNGKEWRLYCKDVRSSKFFEIDLEACLENLQKFKYFYVLFRPAAFIKNSSGKCLLDNILDESLRFQEDIEKDLREKVFKCVEWLGHGFLSGEENHLSEQDLDLIYHHSLILLYRILFVLNAEARDLLPTNLQTKYYKHYGIQRIKDVVRLEKGEFINAKIVLYDYLSSLFHLINGSNERLNKDMNIPRYNGGLFDPERYNFLEEKKVGDDILSEVIYELSYRTENGDVHSIDYKGLGERHLGTVYEGLLEHKFSIDNGKVILKNDKGERKATGAYYTPDYIVKYIVENTLTPILKEIDERVKKEYKGIKDASFAEEVLKLNICDPAMGSGHFLVEAVQYLADEIAYHPTTELKTPKGKAEEELNYWKRKVVESCIYGIDIKNLAVELAKLSLWLKTVDKSQPLNFLDHHLRCGNSLIGARINDLNHLPSLKGKQKKIEEQEEQLVLFDKDRFSEDITSVIKGFHSIEEMPSEKLSDIKAKEKTFHKLTEELDRYREIANLWTSLFFGNNLEEKEQEFEELLQDQFRYQMNIFGSESEVAIKKKPKAGISGRIYGFVVSSLQSPDRKVQISALASLLEKSEAISRDKNFFHWELEFPEVFFNKDGSPKENPGFDCVIGNPPYVRIQKMEEESTKKYLRTYQTTHKNYDIYIPFVERGLTMLNSKGYFGYIMPNKFLQAEYGEKLRKYLCANKRLRSILNFGHNQIFSEEATNYTCLLFLAGEVQNSFGYIEIQPLSDINAIPSIFASINDDKRVKTGIYSPEEFSYMPWVFGLGNEAQLLDKIKKISLPLGELVDRIIVGLQTSADKVFIMDISNKRGNHLSLISKSLTKEIDLESIFLKPIISGTDVKRYGIPEKRQYILFPYKTVSGKLELVSEKELENKTPKTHSYLKDNELLLRNRENGRMNFDGWYGFIYKKNMDKQEINKLCLPRLINRLQVIYDKNGEYYLDNVDVNGILLNTDSPYRPEYFLSLLNGRLMDFVFKKGSVKFRGEYYSANKQFIAPLPIANIFFTTPEKERRERVAEAIRLYQKEIESIAINADKWQNKNEVKEDEKGRDKKGSAKARQVAGKPRGYKFLEEGLSGQGSRLGGKVHGVREGAGEYGSAAGTPGEGEDSTRPLDSTRYFETAQGIKTYSEVSEILAVSVAKTLEALIDGTPEEITITPEWICKLHGEIASSLFTDWAGRLRDVNVVVGMHTPPPYFEVPIHVRRYCDDLAARLSFAAQKQDIETFAETLAFVDWRFQWIHPFKDFNGRVGRILLAAVLFKLRLPPAETASVEPEEKEKYLQALCDADEGDLSRLTTIWIERLSKTFHEK